MADHTAAPAAAPAAAPEAHAAPAATAEDNPLAVETVAQLQPAGFVGREQLLNVSGDSLGTVGK